MTWDLLKLTIRENTATPYKEKAILTAVEQYINSQNSGKPIVRLALAGLEADAVEDAYAYSETHEDVSDRIGQHLVKSAYLDGARSVIQKLKANAG